ncbi:MAG: FlaG protein [Solidesulfovibrio magneticus str. Maddingley MBC34]|uniref:FlaG protein n=1 Tax=Solidesulfovibrio magneticus str. Maddingley MBC34 TaxID=1206767 RepID=K6GNH8_9BACT|nr:MAG: FlaG protein [Solidesulfovibrio magneticus str. Maddingley MBC34]
MEDRRDRAATAAMSDSANTPPLGAPAPTQTAPQRTAPSPAAGRKIEEHAAESTVREIQAAFPNRSIALRVDEATQIVQTLVRDDATGKLLRELPDEEWLRLVVKLRAFAAEAILDKSV